LGKQVDTAVDDIFAAAKAIIKANESLECALEKLGGPLEPQYPDLE